MNWPNLDDPVVIFSLAFGPLGVIICLEYFRRRRK